MVQIAHKLSGTLLSKTDVVGKTSNINTLNEKAKLDNSYVVQIVHKQSGLLLSKAYVVEKTQ